MTSYDVYIGNPKEWVTNAENSWDGNFPQQLGPVFPPRRGGSELELFSAVQDLESEGLVVERVDWGCWIVSVTRRELLEFLDRWYGKGPIYPPIWTIRERGNREDNEIRQFVENLDGSTRYLLVALET